MFKFRAKDRIKMNADASIVAHQMAKKPENPFLNTIPFRLVGSMNE